MIQNQNSQQIPAVPIQPRLYNAQGRPVQINPGCGTYNSVPIPPSTISNGLYQGGQSSGYGVVGPGISAGQSQFIQTNVPTNKQSITTSNSGGSSFTQSQTIHQGGPVVGITAKDKPIEYLEQLNLPYSEPDLYNQKVIFNE